MAERLAWLARVVPELPGSGIVYSLTVRDARLVADWLSQRGLQAAAYYGDIDTSTRVKLESDLRENRIKALVATSALGMGFDKPDLRFVIHAQTPQSLVHYYQQVGRAGRAVDEAFGILLHGQEDQEIVSYFIRNAFPAAELVENVVAALEESEDGLQPGDLEAQLNIRRGALTQALKFLETEDPPPVVRDGKVYRRTAMDYCLDQERIDRITALRWKEWRQIVSYVHSQECLMQQMARALGDDQAAPCGTCPPCGGLETFLQQEANRELVVAAQAFLRRVDLKLEPRKRWEKNALPEYGFDGKISPGNQPGRALARWGDSGWGEMIRIGKDEGDFCDELVDALAALVRRWAPDPQPTWVTCVPSMRHPLLVPDLAQRLARNLGLPFREALDKVRETAAQKEMANSYYQARNLDGAFLIVEDELIDGPVFLVDDVVDSRWTFTIAGHLLSQAGVPAVHPLALANASIV